jgi:hypothetical protein
MMTKNEAHAILDKIRDGLPVAGATEALLRTGDISRLPCQSLRTNGDESRNDRAVEVESKGVKRDFSYSAYLDSEQNKGVKE